jgi:Mg2+/citrate symporter
MAIAAELIPAVLPYYRKLRKETIIKFMLPGLHSGTMNMADLNSAGGSLVGTHFSLALQVTP